MRLVLACLVPVLLAACGDDGGGGGGGGGNPADAATKMDAPAPDAYVPPAANCTPLDLASAAAIPITNGQVTPNPQGGPLHSATFKLTTIKLNASGITVTGTAKARVEFVTGNATSGAARVALIIDAMAFGQPVQQNVAAGGLYTIAATALNLTDGCGGSNPLSGLSYTAAGSSLTMWTTYMVTTPVMLTIPIELTFAAE